ncbi:MAG: MFS transporter [Gemmatimonadales bacterium]|nr:MFS transporter [Gemmatimonadales bacterium]
MPTTAQRSALRLVLLTVFIDLIGFAIVLPLLPSYGAKYGASDAAIGVLVASYSLMQLLFAPWWGRLSDRIGRRPVLLIGLVGSAASYLLF